MHELGKELRRIAADRAVREDEALGVVEVAARARRGGRCGRAFGCRHVQPRAGWWSEDERSQRAIRDVVCGARSHGSMPSR